MALQTQDLVMVGLGIQGDTPSNYLQPPLIDGIHLRWAFNSALGFPWHGFYLFRRPHQQVPPKCLSRLLEQMDFVEGPQGVISLTIPPFGEINSNANLVLTDDFPTPHDGGPLEMDLRGRRYLRMTFVPEYLARRVDVTIGFRAQARIDIVAFYEDTPVVRTFATGDQNEIRTVILEEDAITAVQIGTGPAALIEFCFVPVSPDATQGWELVPNFPYPLRLPVTQPDYPCTLGQAEDLAGARSLARRRIQYGDPDLFTAPASAPYSDGTISIATGSPVVTGIETGWSPDLVGRLLRVDGDSTAYAIATVLPPDKLVLARPYVGVSRVDASYTITQDDFGQLHDYLIHLVTGGEGAGSMANRSLPPPIFDAGTIQVTKGAATVTGIGTDWDQTLAHLSLQVIHQTSGTVTVNEASRLVTGDNTAWTQELVGSLLQILGEPGAYTISRVESEQRLHLDRTYRGKSSAGKAYSAVEKPLYTIESVDGLTQQLTLSRNYLGTSSNEGGKSYRIVCALESTATCRSAPRMYRQRPLDWVLLGTLHPAVAQMVGIYWVDQKVDADMAYDYLIVGDYKGNGELDEETVLSLIRNNGFVDLDAYIVFNKRMAPRPRLSPPTGLRVHALPSSVVRTQNVASSDAGNSAGLRWNLEVGGRSRFAMYHLWRASLGNGAEPLGTGDYEVITKEFPILVGDSIVPLRNRPSPPPDWPPDRLHYLDSGLREGWYGYQVTGIDIFGRHSANSASAPWYQWEPMPNPRPWYYIDPPREAQVHPSAVRLVDKTPPPPPTAVEAFALETGDLTIEPHEPLDRTILRDSAYRAWRNSLIEASWYQDLLEQAKKNLLGLRVRWQWTHAHMRQAPDTREFRIYYHSGQMNSRLGRTVAVSSVTSLHSDIETDIPNDQPRDAYVGAQLVVGPSGFQIVGSDAEDPLHVRVRNIGPSYNAGRVAVANGSPTVTGTETQWRADLVGSTLQIVRTTEGTVSPVPGTDTITGDGTDWDDSLEGLSVRVAGDHTVYTIDQVISPTELRLSSNYVGSDAGARGYTVFDNTAYVISKVDSPTQLRLDRDYTGTSYPDTSYNIYKRPRADAPCTLAIPPAYAEGTVSVNHFSAIVTGLDTSWGSHLVDMGFRVQGDLTPYVIAEVESPNRLRLDRTFTGRSGTDKNYAIRFPRFVDYSRPTNWEQRYYVVGYNEHVTPTAHPAKDAGGNDLKGNTATVNGVVVSLSGSPDLSRVRPNVDYLSLAEDTNRSDKVYRIVAVDDTVKTITLDGEPNTGGVASSWIIGLPMRRYELFLPTPDGTHRDGLPLTTSLAKPIAYGHIGVSAADDKSHTEDDPQWAAGNWGGRFGNEGRLGAIAKIFRVRRDRPQPPIPPPDSEKVYATPADYHGRSFYTYRWRPEAHLKTHIFRALDDTVFKVDWGQRPRAALDLAQVEFFPDEETEPRWDAVKRQQVAEELNQLNNFNHQAEGTVQAMAYYGGLSNDALRVLAALDRNERAFAQITIQPLDPDDLLLADRPGPDNPSDFPVDDNLCIYVDTLDGRSTNRYFYRASYVDGAHNRSYLSLPSPPVYLPNVVPPRAPVITKVLGGDRQITLKWASNREPDLAEYRVYRADSKESARDLRLMTRIHTEKVPIGDPAARIAEIEWIDRPVPGLRMLFYRLVAVDEVENVSDPSVIISAQASDESPPVPPALAVIWTEGGDGIRAQAVWTCADETLLQRRKAGGTFWTTLSGWLSPGEHMVRDTRADVAFSYEYRLRVRKSTGAAAIGAPTLLDAMGG